LKARRTKTEYTTSSPKYHARSLFVVYDEILEGLMDTATIIGHLDAEISKLQQAKALLAGTDGRKGPGRPKASGAISKPVAIKPTKRVMSAAGKKKIALAQKARWAKVRKATKKAENTRNSVEKGIKPTAASASPKAVKKAAKT
jgi:hypothetical protein